MRFLAPRSLSILPLLLAVITAVTPIPGSNEEEPTRGFTGSPGAPVLAGCGGAILLIDESGEILRKITENVGNMGDCQFLSNGNILYADADSVKEIDPSGNRVREFTDPTGGKDFTFSAQRLPDGSTVVGVNNANQIFEYDADGKLVKTIDCAFTDQPGSHHNNRWVRKTSSGTYLVAHKQKGTIAEYDGSGKILKTMAIPGKEVYGVAEVPETGEIYGTFLDAIVLFDRNGLEIWRCSKEDLPQLELTWICSIFIRKNGNLVLGNYAANRDGVHAVCAFEITREKEVVWSWRDPDGPDSYMGVSVLESETP